jgi:shikimate kinase
MGAGKSAVGRSLAGMLGVTLFDSDSQIESNFKMTVSEIFERYGEEKFREHERNTITELIRKMAIEKESQGAVISLGGGAFENPDIRQIVKEHCFSVWLSANIPTIIARIGNATTRPLLKGSRDEIETLLKDLLEKRTPAYQKADIFVSTDDLSPKNAAKHVLLAMQKKGITDTADSGKLKSHQNH